MVNNDKPISGTAGESSTAFLLRNQKPLHSSSKNLL
ncbi:hypothetical protein PPTG_23144 [Phytophthora nicotianae INRA-310]|uniref:Uncharacterized protein n=1 Tax=Phytophthora nicotianae (strain INRA-310) TaxID=761204 RepID=W2Q5W7_PHYN3|nr:hypothetical protein PPTG_23144 [Phytophthora nicotianae INRA-310]ETN07645.1 hypothetical protein PPTG_23144 [Phytophthora nicotianae INRA-310]